MSRRLIQLTLGLSLFVFVPVYFGAKGVFVRQSLLVATALLVGIMAWLSRSKTSSRARSVGIVVVFALIGLVGYSTIGFLSAPGLAACVAIVMAGLLLGRRAMIATALLVGLAVATIAALMVNGSIPAPLPVDISPLFARTWLRTSVLSLFLILILGFVVTGVVQQIEQALGDVEAEATRRREAELQVEQAQRRELIGKLAASLAHDVNNQLTIITAWTSMLSRNTDPRLADACSGINAAVRQASSLSRRLLMLGRQDAPQLKRVDLSRVVASVESSIRALVSRDIALDFSLREQPWCRVDTAQLDQVIFNLVLNAQDAMPEGGSLAISTGTAVQKGGEGLLGPIPVGDWALLTVEDTGTGMAQEVQERAFEPFFTTKEVGKGTGMGLATIAAITEALGGNIVLDSAPGRGTRIEIWLPLESEGGERESSSLVAADLGGVTVLLVEDTAEILELAAQALREVGAKVSAAKDGDEALALAEREHFELLCSDVVMPGVSVSEVVRAFKRQNPTGAALLCSAHVDNAAVRDAIRDGEVDFLAKPYSSDLLIGRLVTLRTRQLRLAEDRARAS